MRPILLVAWRASASASSSRAMPAPSSRTRQSATPPPSTSISMRRAPASRLFSTSSLTTDAGTLDDLAGRDLVDQLFGQDPDGHGDGLAVGPRG